MTPKALHSQIALGEDSKHQFKVDVHNAESLAAEMAAFANTDGGRIFIGVADDGSTPGLGAKDVSRINQLIGNAASQLVRSPLTVQTENVRVVSYVAKGLLPYHGLGSGIKRALEEWPEIEFIDDHDGCLFQVTLTRKPVGELDLVDEDASKTTNAPKNAPVNAHINDLQRQMLQFIGSNPQISYDHLAELTQKDRTTVMRNLAKLKTEGLLRRIGSRKTGHWEIIECSSRISTN